MSDEPDDDEIDRLIRASARSHQVSADELAQLRAVTKKLLPELRAIARKQADAFKEAERDGRLHEYCEQLRTKCAKCGGPVVLHLCEVNPDTGKVTDTHFCEVHAREYRQQPRPDSPQP